MIVTFVQYTRLTATKTLHLPALVPNGGVFLTFQGSPDLAKFL